MMSNNLYLSMLVLSVAYGDGQISFKRIRRHLQPLGFALQLQCTRAPDLDSISPRLSMFSRATHRSMHETESKASE